MSTYVPIQAITLSAAAASVDFTGIPQTYTDLVIVASARYVSTNTGQGLGIRFNGDTTSNYSFTILEGNGSAASSYRVSSTSSGAMGAIANGSQTSFAVVSTSIQNYTNNTTNKTYIARQSGPSFVQGIVGLWRATPAPITSISIFGSGTAGNIDSGSTFTLYGIGSGSPKAFGGDEVRTDGTYWYHIFRSSGRFEPVESLTCDYLVIAGGGGSGFSSSANGTGTGGGGAGGLRSTVGTTGGGGSLESALSLTANTNYTVTIGAGGSAGTGANTDATDGSNSVFSTITSTGGGGSRSSGVVNGAIGRPGGSGAGNCNGSAGTTNTGTANQGFAGGTASGSFGTGGGGGAAAAGGAGASPNGGNGGNGLSINITGSSVSYAGGGAGGRGASGGASGAAGTGGTAASTSGTANTGAGAGGANSSVNAGYNGGSGIVVVRYAV